MKEVIIGLIGTIGAGKDTVSDYMIKNLGFSEVSLGDIVREEAALRKLEPNRDNLQKISKEMKSKYGEDYWSRKGVEKTNSISNPKIVINGIRTLADVSCMVKTFRDKFILIKVDAKPEIRFERMKRRNRPGDPKTLREFKRQEKNEYTLHGNFDEVLKLAVQKIENNSTIKDACLQTDKLVRKILSRKSETS